MGLRPIGLLGANLGNPLLTGMPEVHTCLHTSDRGDAQRGGLTSRTSSFWRSSGSAGARPMEPRATERSDWLLMRPLSGPAATPTAAIRKARRAWKRSYDNPDAVMATKETWHPQGHVDILVGSGVLESLGRFT